MDIGTYIFVYFIVYIVVVAIFGAICQHINESKGYSGGFAWGFLGAIGLIVVACRSESPARMASYYQQSEALSKLQSISSNPSIPPSRRKITNDWICIKCGRIVPGYTAGCACGMKREESNRLRETQALEKEKAEKDQNAQQTELNNIELLIKYKELLDKGIITQEDFDKKKESILAGNMQKNSKLPELVEEKVSTEWICEKCSKNNPNERGTCFYCGAFKPVV